MSESSGVARRRIFASTSSSGPSSPTSPVAGAPQSGIVVVPPAWVDVNALNSQARRVRRRRTEESSEDDEEEDDVPRRRRMPLQETPTTGSVAPIDDVASQRSGTAAGSMDNGRPRSQRSTNTNEGGSLTATAIAGDPSSLPTPPSTPRAVRSRHASEKTGGSSASGSSRQAPAIPLNRLPQPPQDSNNTTKSLLPRIIALASSPHGLPGLQSLLANTTGVTLFTLKNHALFAAAGADRVATVRYLLRDGAQLDYLEPAKHRNVLHEACSRGAARAVSVLLKADRGRIRKLPRKKEMPGSAALNAAPVVGRRRGAWLSNAPSNQSSSSEEEDPNHPDDDNELSDSPNYKEVDFRPTRSSRQVRAAINSSESSSNSGVKRMSVLASRNQRASSAVDGQGASSSENKQQSLLEMQDDRGDTPLHVALKESALHRSPFASQPAGGSKFALPESHTRDYIMVVRYICREKDKSWLAVKNDEGDTVLHIAARVGGVVFVEELVKASVDWRLALGKEEAAAGDDKEKEKVETPKAVEENRETSSEAPLPGLAPNLAETLNTIISRPARKAPLPPPPWLVPNNRGRLPIHSSLSASDIPAVPSTTAVPTSQQSYIHRPIPITILRMLLGHDPDAQLSAPIQPPSLFSTPATPGSGPRGNLSTLPLGIAAQRIRNDGYWDENSVACIKLFLSHGSKIRDPTSLMVCREILDLDWADQACKPFIQQAVAEHDEWKLTVRAERRLHAREKQDEEVAVRRPVLRKRTSMMKMGGANAEPYGRKASRWGLRDDSSSPGSPIGLGSPRNENAGVIGSTSGGEEGPASPTTVSTPTSPEIAAGSPETESAKGVEAEAAEGEGEKEVEAEAEAEAEVVVAAVEEEEQEQPGAEDAAAETQEFKDAIDTRSIDDTSEEEGDEEEVKDGERLIPLEATGEEVTEPVLEAKEELEPVSALSPTDTLDAQVNDLVEEMLEEVKEDVEAEEVAEKEVDKAFHDAEEHVKTPQTAFESDIPLEAAAAVIALADDSAMIDPSGLPTRQKASITPTSSDEAKSHHGSGSSTTERRSTRRKVPEPNRNSRASINTNGSGNADKRTSAGSWEAAVSSAVEAAGMSVGESLSESVFKAVGVVGVAEAGARTASIPAGGVSAPMRTVSVPSVDTSSFAKPASRIIPTPNSQSSSGIAGSFKKMFGSGSSSSSSNNVPSSPVQTSSPISGQRRDPEPSSSPTAGKVTNLIKKFGGGS